MRLSMKHWERKRLSTMTEDVHAAAYVLSHWTRREVMIYIGGATIVGWTLSCDNVAIRASTSVYVSRRFLT